MKTKNEAKIELLRYILEAQFASGHHCFRLLVFQENPQCNTTAGNIRKYVNAYVHCLIFIAHPRGAIEIQITWEQFGKILFGFAITHFRACVANWTCIFESCNAHGRYIRCSCSATAITLHLCLQISEKKGMIKKQWMKLAAFVYEPREA